MSNKDGACGRGDGDKRGDPDRSHHQKVVRTRNQKAAGIGRTTDLLRLGEHNFSASFKIIVDAQVGSFQRQI
jgi:hypothetical protein